ncbi:MAG: pyrroline-5-carboxylate reductase [Gammaproteobacteria bacterium]|nr:pyrroline-5-carboxylate reductase [Gammaproteobacteria bacterium]
MKLTIIGAGKMGEALGRGILQSGQVTPANLTFTDIAQERVQTLATELGVTAAGNNIDAVRDATLVILAVKPQYVVDVCQQIAPALPSGTTVLSIAAGITLTQLAAALDREDLALARAMPNTPCLVNAGAIGLSFAGEASAKIRDTVRNLLAPTGLVEEVPESQMNAVTGLSGSGPAYIALLIEALTDGGVLMGLPRTQAQQLATQTVFGTAKLILETSLHPALVKDAVSSPGGTTIAGIAALEEAGFRHAAITAIRAATMRANALSGE